MESKEQFESRWNARIDEEFGPIRDELDRSAKSSRRLMVGALVFAGISFAGACQKMYAKNSHPQTEGSWQCSSCSPHTEDEAPSK